MKTILRWGLVPVISLVLVGCGKDEKPAGPQTNVQTANEPATPEVKAPEVKKPEGESKGEQKLLPAPGKQIQGVKQGVPAAKGPEQKGAPTVKGAEQKGGPLAKGPEQKGAPLVTGKQDVGKGIPAAKGPEQKGAPLVTGKQDVGKGFPAAKGPEQKGAPLVTGKDVGKQVEPAVSVKGGKPEPLPMVQGKGPIKPEPLPVTQSQKGAPLPVKGEQKGAPLPVKQGEKITPQLPAPQQKASVSKHDVQAKVDALETRILEAGGRHAAAASLTADRANMTDATRVSNELAAYQSDIAEVREILETAKNEEDIADADGFTDELAKSFDVLEKEIVR